MDREEMKGKWRDMEKEGKKQRGKGGTRVIKSKDGRWRRFECEEKAR